MAFKGRTPTAHTSLDHLPSGPGPPPASIFHTQRFWSFVASCCDDETLEALSLVNRIIGRIAQKQLFYFLYFQASHKDQNNPRAQEAYEQRGDRTIRRFTGIVVSGFAPSVRFLKYIGVYQPEDIGRPFSGYEDIVAYYDLRSLRSLLTLLPNYCGIRKMEMSLVTLNQQEMEIITSLKSLEHLELREVKLTDLPRCRTLPRLKELVFESRKAPKPNGQIIQICQPGALEELKLSPNITLAFLSGLVEGGGCPELQSLEVTVNTATEPVFYELLKTCDNLNVLVVNHDFDDIVMDPYLPADFPLEACANLTWFVGPIFFAARLVPGRPVVSVEIEESGFPSTFVDMDDFVEAVRVCSRSSAPLETLHIATFRADASAMTLINEIGALFPELTSLHLLVKDPKSDEDSDNDVDMDDGDDVPPDACDNMEVDNSNAGYSVSMRL